jgi:LPXTG-motif cell wall-anchored protein
MMGFVGHPRRRIVGPPLAAVAVALVIVAIPAGTASAATLVDTASATVTLDAPGTLQLDQFNPALGTLTSVQVSITATALVQVCIENASAQAGATAGGTASGTLDAAFPGGAARTVATAQATGAAASLTASNGTANCTAGFDAATARFAAPVSAADVTFFQQSNQATNSATLSSSSQLTPFIGTGTVAVSYTAQNDTELVLPAQWQNTAVAQGQLQATVTYTYTVPGAQIPGTGSDNYRTVTIAGIAVLAGVAAVLISKRRRSARISGEEGL